MGADKTPPEDLETTEAPAFALPQALGVARS